MANLPDFDGKCTGDCTIGIQRIDSPGAARTFIILFIFVPGLTGFVLKAVGDGSWSGGIRRIIVERTRRKEEGVGTVVILRDKNEYVMLCRSLKKNVNEIFYLCRDVLYIAL